MTSRFERKKVDFPTITQLAKKIVGELSMPGQFLQPQRRRELVNNALSMLAGSIYRAETSTQQLEMEISQDIASYQTQMGITFYLIDTREHTFVIHLIPESIQTLYVPPKEDDAPSPIDTTQGVIAVLPTTTHGCGTVRNLKLFKIPSQGYMDHRGILQDFKRREPEDVCQHGGMLISNAYRHFEIIPYHHLQEMKAAELVEGEALIEADWYMDSGNQNEVCARENLRGKRVYNCIGELMLANGTRQIITFSTYYSAIECALREKDSLTRVYTENSSPCTMRTIAAAYNYIAKKHKAFGWRICGLEYNGGGLRTGEEALLEVSSRDYIIFIAPKRD